jgi:acetyltransferase-like isoleucine patch superfamily enzyme
MTLERNAGAPALPGLVARIRRSWTRDSNMGLARRIQKGLKLISQLIRAIGALKACNHVGINARVAGRLRIENRGSIDIGHHFNVRSSWVPVELITGPEGRIQIGDDVLINFGTLIAAGSRVTVGSGSMIGPHCIISDVDIPEAIAASAHVTAKPIEIGKDVWLAGRVTVRPGVRIGDGAVVVAGSIVESDVSAHFMASGIPARMLPKFAAALAPRGDAPVTARATGTHRAALRGVLISDFRLDDLVYELAAADASPPLQSVVVVGEQLPQLLTAPPSGDARDFVVVWTRPEAAVPAFAQLLTGELINESDLMDDVDKFCALVKKSATNYRYVLLPTWTQPAHVRGRGLLDGRPGGVLSALSAMNHRVMRNFERCSNVFILNAARWQMAVGPRAFNPRAWYLGQMAMARPLVAEAARDICAALAALCGTQRKLLVFHSNDALWTDGQAHPNGSATPLGQAYAAFQQALRQLRRRGVLLALIGKSTTFDLLETMRAFPGAGLREGDFAICGATEGDEVAKLNALVAAHGVALDAVVYIDARDAVRARVRAALPEVYVPDWPVDRLLFPSAVLALSCFDAGSEQAIALRAVR